MANQAEDFSLLTADIDVDIDRELAAHSLVDYVEMAWPHVEPASPFKPSWGVSAICDHLEAVKTGEIDRLVINVPPGFGKSLLACVFFPTWCWTDWPGAKFISASYAEYPVKRDALRSRGLIDSPWWQARWGHRMDPNTSAWGALHFRNKQGGFRFGTTVGGVACGEHANIQLVDDPLKPLDADGNATVSKNTLEKAITWWDGTMATRLVDKSIARISARVLIMQRLNEGDLSGHVLRDLGYTHLCLPMEYEPKAKPCVLGRKCKAQHRPDIDARTEPQELLDPVRKPRERVEQLKRELGPRGTAAQLEQRPNPVEGSIFKKGGVHYYRRSDLKALRFSRQVQSWDMTFKKTQTGSYVVGQVWGQTGADCYLLDQVRDRWSMTETVDQLLRLTVKWPKAVKKLVEDKANGSAVVDTLKKRITGLSLVEPEGGKEARANAVEPIWEAGNVWLPHPDEAPWIVEFVEEVLGFPGMVHDDQVDTMSQALVHLARHNIQRLKDAMANAGHI